MFDLDTIRRLCVEELTQAHGKAAARADIDEMLGRAVVAAASLVRLKRAWHSRHAACTASASERAHACLLRGPCSVCFMLVVRRLRIGDGPCMCCHAALRAT